jgi:plastocyanin
MWAATRGQRLRYAVGLGAVFGAAAILISSGHTGLAATAGQEQAPTTHEFHVTANGYHFDPPTISVRQDDIVKIVLESVDMPHSFTVDSYRIAKRANAGQTIVFEFRADQAGRFTYYCNLSSDAKCGEMKGELVVSPR